MSTTHPIEIVELEQDNYHVLLSSNFSDGSEGKWVIDTGASKSVFDLNLDHQFRIVEGLGEDLHSAGFSDEPIKSSLAVLNSFSVGKRSINQMKVAVMDLTHINDLYARSAQIRICGLLGSDFLLRHRAVIDYRKKKLILRK